MRMADLRYVTGKCVREWYEWLAKEDMGCCSVCYATDDKYRWCVCMGWEQIDENEFQIAWKIGRQTHNNVMQCDFDVDFEMPWDEEGDVDDTDELIELKKPWDKKSKISGPTRYKGWNGLAAKMRKEARRIFKTFGNKETENE